MSQSSKNIEVELRALSENFSELKTKLLNKDVEYRGEMYIHDMYFCPKDVYSLEEVEMDKIGSYSLRLRLEQKGEQKEKIYLNTKTITQESDHNAWQENEVEINSFQEMREILETIGFKSFFELEKTRFSYNFKDLNILLDDITDFGGCIEVEKMTQKGNEDEAKQEILAFLENLGIGQDQIVQKSVTNLVMKERAKFI